MGTGGFLIRYSNIHMKYPLPIKEVPRLFLKKWYSFNLNISQLQSSHYRNVSTDFLGTGHRSLGICRAHFGNHCYCMEQSHSFNSPTESYLHWHCTHASFDIPLLGFSRYVWLWAIWQLWLQKMIWPFFTMHLCFILTLWSTICSSSMSEWFQRRLKC